LFGPGNPNNWNRDLPTMAARAGPTPPSAATVADVTFQAMSQVHATFWCRHDLLKSNFDWLRGRQWLLAQGKESWEASQQLVRNCWQACLHREAQEEETTTKSSFQWDPVVREAVEAAVKGVSWEAQIQRLYTQGRWTLVHGDFWPGNVMWMIQQQQQADSQTSMDDSKSQDIQGSIRLLDWEMVGVGSGPQDLGQYILSNMDPAERRDCERQLVQAYYEELKRCGVKNVDWDYTVGVNIKLEGSSVGCGSSFTLWGRMACYIAWAQFFHNQMASFMHDHKLTAADVVQPRP
jgi:thiamine kinase-like enzyme